MTKIFSEKNMILKLLQWGVKNELQSESIIHKNNCVHDKAVCM